jgi:hypothetical protein
MATLQELEIALRNADAAGDVDAARQLATEYTRVRGGGESQPKPKYPGFLANQQEMAGESFGQMQRGAGQLGEAFRFAASGAGRNVVPDTPTNRVAGAFSALEPDGPQAPLTEAEHGAANREALGNVVRGTGNAAMGALGYVTSPINAALRTVVGQPVENLTGIPKEYPEFAASFLVPGRVPGLPSRAPKVAAAPTRAELFSEADRGYKEVRATGATFTPELSNTLADHVAATLKSKGAFPHLAKPVHETVDILRRTEGPLGIDELRSVQEALSSLKTDPDSKIRRAANLASEEITGFLSRVEPGAAAALQEANANYAAGSRAKELDQAGEIAGLRAGRAGYGGNAVNTMRQVLSPIVEKSIKGNSKGWNPDEIRAMRDIVEGTTATNSLRGIGQLSPSKGVFSTTVAIASGGVTAAIGAAGNKLATILTRKQIDRLNEMVRKRSPAYAAAVDKSATKFFDSAEVFVADPSQANLVRTIVSARALSAGLSRDGISISSGDLLRSLQRPVNAAEDEQQ